MRRLLGSSVGVVVLLTLAVLNNPRTITGLQRTDGAAPREVVMPYTWAKDGPTGRTTLLFKGTLRVGPLTPPYISPRADDCVEEAKVDGRVVFNGKCGSCEHCKQFRLPLPKELAAGEHVLELRVGDNGGAGFMDLREAHGFTLWDILGLVTLSALWVLVCTWRRAPAWAAWLGVLSVLLASHYLFITDHDTRQHDVHGHKEYVEHLTNKHTLPTVKQGWETWQPPGYYTLATAFAAATAPWMPEQELHRRVQYFAGALYVMTCLLALLWWRRLGFSSGAAWVGPLMLVLMPAHVFQTGRVSNDVIMPWWGMAVTMLCVAYGRNSRLWVAGLLGLTIMAALITKTSSLSLAAGGGFYVLYQDHADGRRFKERLVRAALVGVPGLLWLAFWFWRNKQQTGEWLYVNASLSDGLRVPNVAFKYIWFDLPTFLKEQHFNTFSGDIRQSFPTALAASALTGEYNLEHVGSTWVSFLRLAFVPMLAMFVYGLFTRPQTADYRPFVPAVLLFLAHAFFMTNYNWKYSYACNEDARLWSPIYFPAAVLFSHGYEVMLARWHRRGRWLLILSPVFFAAMAAVFYARLFFPA
jgi:hypothetical protein